MDSGCFPRKLQLAFFLLLPSYSNIARKQAQFSYTFALVKRKVDFLIIGSGIAGLSYALKVAPYGKVLILTKANEDESNTKYAQGGIAGVMH